MRLKCYTTQIVRDDHGSPFSACGTHISRSAVPGPFYSFSGPHCKGHVVAPSRFYPTFSFARGWVAVYNVAWMRWNAGLRRVMGIRSEAGVPTAWADSGVFSFDRFCRWSYTKSKRELE